jgi:hypothetical protein
MLWRSCGKRSLSVDGAGKRRKALAQELFLPRHCQGMIFVFVGYASKDSGPTAGFRLDGQFSIHQTEPLTHADQAKPPAIDRVPPIETDS